jgi:hypothetical protein
MGCGGAVLHGTDTSAGLAGDTLTIQGDDLHQDLVADITTAQGDLLHTLDLHSVQSHQALVTLPEATPPGMYTITLRTDRWMGTSGRAALEIWHPDDEPPCNKRYALRTETTRVRRTIGIDRTIPGRAPQQLRFGPDDYRKLRYTETQQDQAPCMALWLDTNDGSSWLLADDSTSMLAARARAIAEVLEIEIDGLPAQ